MSKDVQPDDGEALALFTTDQLLTELVKRYETAVFVGDTRMAERKGDVTLFIWDRNKDITRAFGLFECAKFRIMQMFTDTEPPPNIQGIY